MNVLYKYIDTLPPLAWIAIVTTGEVCEVIHGMNVEVNDSFFVEGAWDGIYEKGDFDSAEWFCGSGGKIFDDKVVFSTPSHVTNGLFSYMTGEKWVISNSLHLLCVYCGLRIDTQYLYYEVDFNSIISGIDKYKKGVHVINNEKKNDIVYLYYYSNIIYTSNNNVTVKRKRIKRDINSFSDYYNALNNAISGLKDNVLDNSRKFRYGMVTTVSKGYDAPCCAVISHKYGCETAVTFSACKQYADDSGVEIARLIGFEKIIERNANDYLTKSQDIEALVIASGELGGDIQFSAFDDLFSGNMVFTGDRGDSIWGLNNPMSNDSFEFNDICSHIGSQERRLWIGYISVPMPLYCGENWKSIQKISRSSEMKKWSVGGDYDRPIPRRICEEAGIKRDMFGIEKHGAGFLYRLDYGNRVKKRMSIDSANSFNSFLKKNKKMHLVQFAVFIYKIRKVYLDRLGFKVKKPTPIEISKIANATDVRYLFPWASEIVQEKYKVLLKGKYD